MSELSPITRAILQLARWGLEREARETGNVDELAGMATSPVGDGSEEAADLIVRGAVNRARAANPPGADTAVDTDQATEVDDLRLPTSTNIIASEEAHE